MSRSIFFNTKCLCMTCSNMNISRSTVCQNSIQYSGFLSREKTFANCLKIDFCRENFCEFVVTQCTTSTSAVSNCLKIDFCRENFCEFAVTQCTTPTSAVSNCLKIDFRRENFCEFVVTQCTTPTSAVFNCLKIDFRGENLRESPQKCEIHESFLPRKKPAIRYNTFSLLIFRTVFC